MSEFDFEKLLDGVLREYAQVESPTGMDERVMARVAAQTRQSSQRGMLWAVGAVAAGVLIWVMPHARPRLRETVPSASVRWADPAGGVAGKVGKAPLPVAVDEFAPGKRTRLKQLRDVQQEHPLQIAPIEIAPLTVDSMEIASLGMEEEQKKEGDVQ